MKKLIFVLLLIVLIVIGLLVVVQIKNKQVVSDLIVVSEVNLGEVNLSSKKEFKIKLTNNTGKDFGIAKIYTSCGCTGVLVDESESTSFLIKPKETIYVNLEFDPSSMHQEGDTIDHEVYVLVSSPVEKEYVVKILGEVI
ncbi:hypothetical protein A2W32_04015 [candidate division WWE3 bacterium RBG_16_37_10]|uniref:DUF1573 domain-containing protein n=1 Tax=candidate division WWE3 bacterium RBG_16_37_10 TaxID=1802610 RepID=A0A1F4UUR4_UNCKA|nr:MAG: hypothetical protein A2W32_04015 [candidate division WWE3 bacterium RBG_16_37_10]